MNKKQINADEIENCISILEHLLQNGDQLANLNNDQRIKLIKAAGKISRPDRAELKKRNKSVNAQRREAVRSQNRQVRASTSIRQARIASVFEAPNVITSYSIHYTKLYDLAVPTELGKTEFEQRNNFV